MLRKMPRPFPYPLSIGTDICSIPRILTILTRPNGRNGLLFVNRILTVREREDDMFVKRVEVPLKKWQVLGERKRALQFKGEKLELWRETNENGNGQGERWRKTVEEKPVWEDGASVGVERDRAVGNRVKTGGRPGGVDKMGGEFEEYVLIRDEEVEPAPKMVTDLDIMTNLYKEMKVEELQVKNELATAAQFLAGRFAAKEAVIKAYRSRRLTLREISILSTPMKNGITQAPVALVKDSVVPYGRDTWAYAQTIPISISHDGDYAIAVCMVADNSGAAEEIPRGNDGRVEVTEKE